MFGLLRIGAYYDKIVQSYPLRVNCVVGMAIAGIGDVACQMYEHKLESEKNHATSSQGSLLSPFMWDKRRTAELSFIRATIVTPFIYYWYPILLRVSPGHSIKAMLGRIVLDQSVGAPVVISAVLMASSLLKGKSWGETTSLLRQNGPDTWLKGFQFWPIVQQVNFRFVPARHQPLFAHVASVYWNAVLSYYANKSVELKSANPLNTEDTKQLKKNKNSYSSPEIV